MDHPTGIVEFGPDFDSLSEMLSGIGSRFKFSSRNALWNEFLILILALPVLVDESLGPNKISLGIL